MAFLKTPLQTAFLKMPALLNISQKKINEKNGQKIKIIILNFLKNKNYNFDKNKNYLFISNYLFKKYMKKIIIKKIKNIIKKDLKRNTNYNSKF